MLPGDGSAKCAADAPTDVVAAASSAGAASSSSGPPDGDAALAKPVVPAMRGGRPKPKTLGRVTWDEEAITEHDKDRGTRQKIDEPDTPFAHSPQKVSDSGSEDDGVDPRLSLRVDPSSGIGAAKPPLKMAGGSPTSPTSPVVDPAALRNRLEFWVKSGGDQRRPSAASSGGGSSTSSKQLAEEGRRISLDDICSPKAGTDQFKAKRAQHYNEFAAIKAFKNSTGSSAEDSDDSEKAKQKDRRASLEEGQSPRLPNDSFKTLRAQHYNEIDTVRALSKKAAASSESDGSEEESKCKMERRVSLSEDAEAPKIASDSFKAKRSQHYNEGAALKKALKSSFESSESDGDSSGEGVAGKSGAAGKSSR
mmetsp:Transcript_129541/g.415313  ORF Transcript_129541/g.415313 Transcript_129541/m.415313 type:complete len:365 (-) Transcript_129541:16-1110(-)